MKANPFVSISDLMAGVAAAVMLLLVVAVEVSLGHRDSGGGNLVAVVKGADLRVGTNVANELAKVE